MGPRIEALWHYFDGCVRREQFARSLVVLVLISILWKMRRVPEPEISAETVRVDLTRLHV